MPVPLPLCSLSQGGALALLLLTGAAARGEDLRGLLAPCDGLEVPRDTALERVGESGPAEVLHLTGKRGRSLLILHPADEDEETSAGERCELYPIGVARARANGRFVAGRGELKVYALAPPRCSGESCPLVVPIRGEAPRPLYALRTAEHCDAGVELRPQALFADRQGIELTCRRGSGAGYSERRVLLAVLDGALRPLHAIDAGAYEAPSAEERRRRACPARPAGWIRVTHTGDRPRLRSLTPEAADMQDGAGKAPVYEWTFDPAQKRFVRGDAATLTPFDARKGCRR